MKTSDFNYDLPEEFIAQEPAPIRDQCKLLCMNKDTGEIKDRIFKDIYDYVNPGDLLVVNETRVAPCRLIGKKKGTGGVAAVFLLNKDENFPSTENSVHYQALVKPGRRLKSGAVVEFTKDSEVLLEVEVKDFSVKGSKGQRLVELRSFNGLDIDQAVHKIGNTPLPPYIHDYAGDMEMYQTVYSNVENSAAAPTAGLHFTDELIDKLKQKGAKFAKVDLEVGLDTFRTVEEEDPEKHQIHTELYSVPEKTVKMIEETKASGKRVIAVGTTSVRSLESAASSGNIEPCTRKATDLYILPGYEFKVVDAIITNFHIPQSTLLMLVSAFSSLENIQKAYEHAKREKYRFLSFGDAMFLY